MNLDVILRNFVYVYFKVWGKVLLYPRLLGLVWQSLLPIKQLSESGGDSFLGGG